MNIRVISNLKLPVAATYPPFPLKNDESASLTLYWAKVLFAQKTTAYNFFLPIWDDTYCTKDQRKLLLEILAYYLALLDKSYHFSFLSKISSDITYFSKTQLKSSTEKLIPILDILAHQLSQLDKDKDHDYSLSQIFREYVELDDDLITLIFENSYFDIRYHGLKIISQQGTIGEGLKIKAGEFDFLSRTLAIDMDMPIAGDTFIHELAHAAIFYLFRPKFMSVGKLTPYTEPLLTNQKFPFNISELKFKQCIREDMANQKMPGAYLFSPAIDYQYRLNKRFVFQSAMIKQQISSFFSNIQACYSQDIYHEKSSGEIFSFYMQLRASLLLLAHAYNIDKDYPIAVLSNHFPRLHSYFETDVKRLLKSRLKDLLDDQGHGLKSNVIKMPLTKNNYVTNADLKYIVRGFWHERLRKGTGYSFFQDQSEAAPLVKP